MKKLHVDEIESLPVLNGELQWKPVRHALGVSAFGINAYTGAKEGDLVVEEHEDPHEELYLVLTGRAHFKVGDDELDAPAGTFVLFEPHEHRVAHAAEPGTTVVAVGAEAARFEPSGWEFAFRAKAYFDLGRLEEARATVEDGFARYPERADLFYTRACINAQAGDLDAARADFERAAELYPGVREWAADDPALRSVTNP